MPKFDPDRRYEPKNKRVIFFFIKILQRLIKANSTRMQFGHFGSVIKKFKK